jgi:uncharacterized protein (UPF0332 family)
MNGSESREENHRKALIPYWMEKARESMESAKADSQAGRFSTAVRSIYYACFYALSAVLWKQGKSFKKHTGVRAAMHRDLVKPGMIENAWGEFYELIFDRRHKGDYEPMVSFDSDQVKELFEGAEGFIAQMKNLLER